MIRVRASESNAKKEKSDCGGDWSLCVCRVRARLHKLVYVSVFLIGSGFDALWHRIGDQWA